MPTRAPKTKIGKKFDSCARSSARRPDKRRPGKRLGKKASHAICAMALNRKYPKALTLASQAAAAHKRGDRAVARALAARSDAVVRKVDAQRATAGEKPRARRPKKNPSRKPKRTRATWHPWTNYLDLFSSA